MNREIKFRAWDKVRKEYLSGGQILISIEPGKRPEKSNVYLDILKDANMYNNRFIIEQFTGLKDKNGKEIYEGDVIREKVDKDEYLFAEVIYKDGCFMGKEFMHEPEYPIFDFIRGEVIGSIYENPELLEVENE